MTDDALMIHSRQPSLPVRGLIEGFAVSADGKVSVIAEAGQKPPRGGFIWLHLSVGEAGELIDDKLRLDPMVSRSLLAAETRPRCQHLRQGVLLNLRGVNLNEGRRPEDMISVRCYLEPQRLITVRLQKSLAIEELRDRYRMGEGHERPGQLLIDIISSLMTLIDPIADGLADSIDGYEERASANAEDQQLKDAVAAMRHDAVVYRRYLSPMHQAIARLASKEAAGLQERDLETALEESDRALRIVEELDFTIDRAGVIVDQLEATRTEKMNRNMMVLSVVSVVFMPLSFVTGLLGINVGGIPGAENPHAFLWVVGFCLVICILAATYFKSRDWF